jgi:hypothetical protein
LRLNQLDSKGKSFEEWTFKITANGYRLFSEIEAPYDRDYYGQLTASIDKSINSKISASATFKYGNESAKYESVSAATLSFKYKF